MAVKKTGKLHTMSRPVNNKIEESPEGPPNGPKNLTREAYRDIRRMIFVNELKPGQKIAYRKMAERLGMSLTPVVQVLKHMEFMGLLRHEPNRGFFIEKITPEEIDEVYELRELLEMNMIEKAVERLDAPGERKLRQALDDYLDASRHGSLKLRIAKDINFHMTLAGLAGQPVTLRMLRHLFDFLYLRFEQEQLFARPQEKSDSEHQAIFDRVVARDAPGAREVIRRHIRMVRENAMEGIRKRLDDTKDIDF